MQAFTQHSGLIVPLDRANVDTDQIIPKQFLLAVSRTGFGKHLFFAQRYLDSAGQMPNPDFVLNQPRYQGGSILLARENFGSGSSREHAPWALMDYGFKVIVAPSFADIFANNALGNGLVLVKLTPAEVEALFEYVNTHAGATMMVDLERMTVTCGPHTMNFTMDPFRRKMLLEGLDAISLTLQDEAHIAAYERRQPRWLASRVFHITENEMTY